MFNNVFHSCFLFYPGGEICEIDIGTHIPQSTNAHKQTYNHTLSSPIYIDTPTQVHTCMHAHKHIHTTCGLVLTRPISVPNDLGSVSTEMPQYEVPESLFNY